MEPTPQIRTRAVSALVRMQLSKVRRVAVSATIAIAALVALDAADGGLTFSAVLAWVLGGSLMLPLGPVLGVVREKADGSLRFLATLPITGTEHALARAVTVLVTSVPATVVIATLVLTEAPELPPYIAVMAGGVSGLLLAGSALSLTAAQLKAPIGRGAVSAMYWIVGFVVSMRLVFLAWERFSLPHPSVLLSDPRGLLVASVALWTLVAAMCTLSWRSIALLAPRYRGEAAEE